MQNNLIEHLKILARHIKGKYPNGERALAEAITALESIPAWVKCSERLPEIDYSQPEYSRYVDVIAANENSVRQLRYKSQGFAMTEKGRAPRFEELDGRLAYMTPTMWQLMPALPAPPKVDKGEK